jgi:hypothetical protein
MIFGALPSVLQKGQGVAPFLISLLTLAVGAGKKPLLVAFRMYGTLCLNPSTPSCSTYSRGTLE